MIAAAVHFLRLEQKSETGAAYAIDGDTLFRAGERMRLLGIDAPEIDQTCTVDSLPVPCGRRARDALRDLVRGGVSCSSRSRDAYGRALVTCQTAAGDVSERMVAMGHALASGCCRSAEVEARRAKRGIWAGRFDRPSDWRRLKRAPDAPSGLLPQGGWRASLPAQIASNTPRQGATLAKCLSVRCIGSHIPERVYVPWW